MTDSSPSPEKKIIVDEDWKTQVEREREMAEKEKAQTESAGPKAAKSQEIPLPPANLTYLAGSLYFQASISLGLMPNPADGKTETNLAHAKHAIDMLEMLQAKTEGNRTQDESDEIEAMLHQLRMTYVQMNR